MNGGLCTERGGVLLDQRVELLPPPEVVQADEQRDVPVYYVTDDALSRGIAPATMIDGVQPVPAGDLPTLFDRYEQVWMW